MLLAVAWLSAPLPAWAQAHDSAVPAVVAGLVDERTFAIVCLDTKRIDLAGAVRQISAIPLLSERQRSDLAEHQRGLSRWLEQFHQAGGGDIWIVVTLDDLMDSAIIVVPLAEGANRPALEGLFVGDKLKPAPGLEYPFIRSGILERDGGLVFADDRALKRLRDFHGPTRPIPQPALDAVAGAEIRAFVLITDDQRRVLREFLRDPQAERTIAEHLPVGTLPPEFPRDPGEIARLALGSGLQWIAAGLSTQDPLALKLVIGSKDAVSAKALELWMAGAWRYVRQIAATQPGADSAMVAGLIDPLSRLLAPKVEENQLTVRVDLRQLTASAVGALLGQAASGVVDRSENAAIRKQLKQLALAMHNYHDVEKHFPPPAIRDPQGRPLLSWRVMLLPYLEEAKLYREFHLNEPWDSEHNKPLIARMPAVFAAHSARLRAEGKTTLVAPVGQQTVFGLPEGVAIQSITDGTSNTIMIVDVDDPQAVIWTKPDDLSVDGVDAKQAVYGSRKEAPCAFADGSARILGPQLTTEQVRNLLTRNGGEPVSIP